MSNFLFIVASAREPGQVGNTEALARRAASALPSTAGQAWMHLADHALPEFVDRRHTVGTYPWPEGTLRELLDATMTCTDLVLVTPVYWYSFPSALKTYLDHWSAWMRIEGLPFKAEMAKKRLHLITTSGDRAKAQPMVDSTRLCAEFLSMSFAGVLWGKGGAPRAVESDAVAMAAAERFLNAT
jgi:NAD(P)H-dependent FMN reductase